MNIEWIKLSSEIEIPMVGLGTYDLKEEEIQNGIRSGYRMFDTASQYENEEEVGRAIKRSGVSRREIIISTKLWTEDIRRHNVRQAALDSLKRLDTDYIDIFLIHWPAEGYTEAWLEMEKLLREGLVRSIGVCNCNRRHLEALQSMSEIKPVINQIESHPVFSNDDLIQYCKEIKIQTEAWCPLGGSYAKLTQKKELVDIAGKYGVSVAQLILRWHLQRGVIVIPRSSRAEHQRSNLDLFGFDIRDEDMLLISNLNTNKRLGADPDNFNF